MMVQRSKKKHLFIIVTSIIIGVGVLAFVLAYGFSDGWAAVAQWFGSKYAILLYILIGCYGFIVTWLLISDRIKRL